MSLLDFITIGFGAGLAVLSFSVPAAFGIVFFRACVKAGK